MSEKVYGVRIKYQEDGKEYWVMTATGTRISIERAQNVFADMLKSVPGTSYTIMRHSGNCTKNIHDYSCCVGENAFDKDEIKNLIARLEL